MKCFRICAASLSLMGMSLFAEEASEQPVKEVCTEKYNRLNVGVDHFDLKFKSELVGDDYRVSREETGSFDGIRIELEHLKPNGFYLALRTMTAAGNMDFSRTYKSDIEEDAPIKEVFSPVGVVANSEWNIGYSFPSFLLPKSTLAAFVGGGVFAFIYELEEQAKGVVFTYLSGGLKSRSRLTEYFDMGLNLKANFNSHQVNLTDDFKDGKVAKTSTLNTWGYEIGVPLTLNSKSKRWNAEAEPYLYVLDKDLSNRIYGSRFMIGFRY